jgi:hypothetical protein
MRQFHHHLSRVDLRIFENLADGIDGPAGMPTFTLKSLLRPVITEATSITGNSVGSHLFEAGIVGELRKPQAWQNSATASGW